MYVEWDINQIYICPSIITCIYLGSQWFKEKTMPFYNDMRPNRQYFLLCGLSLVTTIVVLSLFNVHQSKNSPFTGYNKKTPTIELHFLLFFCVPSFKVRFCRYTLDFETCMNKIFAFYQHILRWICTNMSMQLKYSLSIENIKKIVQSIPSNRCTCLW